MDLINHIIPVLAASAAPGGETSGMMGGLIFYISLALSLSFVCSLLEAGLLSSPASYIETQASTGSCAGLLMQKHKLNVEKPITAILTLNTVAHTVGAAGAGAEAVGVFGNEWFGVISAVLTFLILAFSEILPKTLGATYWKQLFPFTVYTVQAMIWVLYPAVWAFQAMTKLITSEDKTPTVTRNELEMMAQISATEGTLEVQESQILHNLLQLNGVQIFNIMTPRTVMFALQQDLTAGEVVNDKRVIPYSRIPVYDDNIDDITGFVLRHDILKRVASDQDSVTLKEMIRPIHTVPETLTAAKVLKEFTQRQQHIFLVIDEYGGTAGLITMEDAVEALLGTEITDESDLVADLRQLAGQRYQRQHDLLEATNFITKTPASLNGSYTEMPITADHEYSRKASLSSTHLNN